MYKILVVEDDEILRDFLVREINGLSQLAGLEVKSTSTIADSLLQIDAWVPDAIILDLSLPDGSGVHIAEKYSSLHPSGKVMILTGQVDYHEIPKNTLSSTLYAVLNKSGGLDPLRHALWDLIQEIGARLPDTGKLTMRQMEMLRLIGSGFDTNEIAEYMGITFATAQTHRRQITKRLGVKGSRLVALANNLPATAEVESHISK